MTNTDGEDLEPQVAIFAVEERRAVLAELERRNDVADAGCEGEYSWLAAGSEPELLGGEKVLGHLHLGPDELRLDVNSTNRLLTARSWLDAIPGVTYRHREVRDIDEMFARATGPRVEPPPPPPELAETLREMAFDRSMRWLDEPLPMFGGRTPRQMCATEDGMLRVAATIRAMPDPGGSLETVARTPREAMLRELGIE